MADDPRITAMALENATAFARFHLAPHLKSLCEALDLKIIASQVLFPNTVGLAIDKSLGSVIVVFDAINGGVGPGGFDSDLIGKLVEEAVGIVVVTRFANADPYTQAVRMAFEATGIVLLVETVDSRAGEWLQLSKSARGKLWSLWSGEVGGSA